MEGGAWDVGVRCDMTMIGGFTAFVFEWDIPDGPNQTAGRIIVLSDGPDQTAGRILVLSTGGATCHCVGF